MDAKWYPVFLVDGDFPFGNGFDSMAAAEMDADRRSTVLEEMFPGKFKRSNWEAQLLTAEQVKKMRGQ